MMNNWTYFKEFKNLLCCFGFFFFWPLQLYSSIFLSDLGWNRKQSKILNKHKKKKQVQCNLFSNTSVSFTASSLAVHLQSLCLPHFLLRRKTLKERDSVLSVPIQKNTQSTQLRGSWHSLFVLSFLPFPFFSVQRYATFFFFIASCSKFKRYSPWVWWLFTNYFPISSFFLPVWQQISLSKGSFWILVTQLLHISKS